MPRKAIVEHIHHHEGVEHSPQHPVPRAIHTWLTQAFPRIQARICLDLWGSERVWLGGECGSPAKLIVHLTHPGIIRSLLLSLDPLVLVEAYLNGFLEFDGKLEDVIQLLRELDAPQFSFAKAFRACLAALSLPPFPQPQHPAAPWSGLKKRSQERELKVIQHHYDVGNEFYGIFLDPLFVYSSAYFEEPGESLAKAQERKLDIICRKLNLKPGEKLLDIGCGWGALLRYAVKNYGVTGFGITLSKQQVQFNRARIAEEGLGNRLEVELRDYRDLANEPAFDKIASIGMIEHVGIRNYPVYFQRILSILKPGGLFLNQGIATYQNWDGSGVGERFVDRYIFPDGNLARLSTIIAAAEEAQWETVHVESWRPHYAKTLRKWAQNLSRALDQATVLAGLRTVKLWLIYLIGSAQAFEENRMNVYAVLLRRKADQAWNMPALSFDWR